ncbi:MAG: hypothetical protein SGPRY_013495, partial [Prymnesium sp.]
GELGYWRIAEEFDEGTQTSFSFVKGPSTTKEGGMRELKSPLLALLVSLPALRGAETEACSAASSLPLTIEDVNPHIKSAEYAVRGRLLDKAVELDAQLKAGEKLPFSQIVRCNIGNPQALGQKPLSFMRRTLSMLMNPELLESPPASYPADVVARAKEYSAAVPSVGAYSDSQGIALVREQVAEFISNRDGYPAHASDIFLTDGASAGVKALMQLMVRGPKDAVLAPIPQYPLYSAVTAMLNGTLAGYYLDEASSWGVIEAELRRALARATDAGATARALVVINPGNPTGQSLPQSVIEMILRFAAHEGLLLMADEVYQENVYGNAPAFFSFKKALAELRLAGEKGDEVAAALAKKAQVISFHSTSKGFLGECGLRGGYFELQNIPEDVKAQIVKLASVSLCSNVVGQFATGLMVRPPSKGELSYAEYSSERQAILDSLAKRARDTAAALDALPGMSCNAAEGAMYLFPQLHLPAAAVAAAEAAGIKADEFYALRLLEATDKQLTDVLKRLVSLVPFKAVFQKEFMATYS